MTIPLEQLADGSISDRNFQRLTSLVPDTGGRSVGIRFGTSTVTFTASASSAGTAVSHGLGTTPGSVVLQEISTSVLIFGVSAVGATTFTASASSTAGALTGTFSFYWIALG